MINPALVVAGIRDTLPSASGRDVPGQGKTWRIWAQRCSPAAYPGSEVTNVTPGTVSTAGNPHVGNELFGLLDGGGQPALQRVGASGSGKQSRAAVLNNAFTSKSGQRTIPS